MPKPETKGGSYPPPGKIELKRWQAELYVLAQLGPETLRAAQLQAARHSASKAELVEFLDMLGLR